MKYLLFREFTYYDDYYEQLECLLDPEQLDGIYDESTLKEAVLKDIDKVINGFPNALLFCNANFENNYNDFSNEDLSFLNKYKEYISDLNEEGLEEAKNTYLQIKYDLHHTEFEDISNIKKYKRTLYFGYSAPCTGYYETSYDLFYYIIRIE